jgi:integrase
MPNNQGTPVGSSGVRYLDPTAARGYYRVLWRDPRSGKNREKSGGKTEARALQVARQVDDQLHAGVPPEPLRERTKVSDALEIWLDMEPHPRWGRVHTLTMAGRARTWVSPAIGARSCGSLTTADCEHLLSHMANRVNANGEPEPMGESSILAVGQFLKQWTSWLKLKGFTSRDLMAGVDVGAIAKPRRMDDGDEPDSADPIAVRPDQVPSKPAIRALIAELEKGTHPWFGLAVELSAADGIRLGELLALKVEDVNVDRREISIRRTLERPDRGAARLKGTKNRRARTVPVPPSIMPKLEARIAQVEQDNYDEPLLFPTSRGKRIHRSNLNHRVMGPAMAAAEEHGWRAQWTFHSLRHTAATEMVNNPAMTITDTSAILGHESGPSFTLKRYAGTTADHLERSAAAMADWEL